jgi:hypothetical protein
MEVSKQIRDPAAVTPEEEHRVLHGWAPEPAWKLRKIVSNMLPSTTAVQHYIDREITLTIYCYLVYFLAATCFGVRRHHQNIA